MATIGFLAVLFSVAAYKALRARPLPVRRARAASGDTRAPSSSASRWPFRRLRRGLPARTAELVVNGALGRDFGAQGLGHGRDAPGRRRWSRLLEDDTTLDPARLTSSVPRAATWPRWTWAMASSA